jgi:hypothetical protein
MSAQHGCYRVGHDLAAMDLGRLALRSVQQDGALAPPTDFIGGTITLSNSVMEGAQFSSADVTALSLSFLGVTGTLVDVQNDPALGGGPVQLTGTLSSNGQSFSSFEFDGGFQTSVSPQCGFSCDFTIHVNSVGGPDNTSISSTLMRQDLRLPPTLHTSKQSPAPSPSPQHGR